MDSWDKIIEHRQRRQLRLDEKEIMKSSYPIKANYLIKNGILTEKMVCCLDDGVLDMFLKKHFRQDSYIKQMIDCDADDNDIIHVDADEEESGNHGNTHIPYGLCQREGIEIGKDWTPRDAWNALEGKGYKASDVYESLKNGSGLSKERKKDTSIDSMRKAAKTFKEEYAKINEEKQNAIKEFTRAKSELKRHSSEMRSYERSCNWVKENNIDQKYIDNLIKEREELIKKKNKFKDKSEWLWSKEEKEIDNRIFTLTYEKGMWEEANDKEFIEKGKEIEKEYNDAKSKCESINKRRREIVDNFRKNHSDINERDYKFYSDEERNEIKQKAKEKFSNIIPDESGRLQLAIDNASDIQLSILGKTMDNVKINKDDNCDTSHYTEGTGIITIDTENNRDECTIFHEYGHYLDDAKISGINYDKTDEDDLYEYGTVNFRDAIDKSKIEKEASEDFENLAKRFGSNIEFYYNEDENYISIKQDGNDVDLNLNFIGNIISGIVEKPTKELKRKYNIPDYPDLSKYYDYYRTPKRGILKSKPKSKKDEEAYRKELKEYYDRIEEIRKDPNYKEDSEKAYKEKEKAERSICGLCDIMSALTSGRCSNTYGWHDKEYYSIGEHRYCEMTANLHQMMFMNDVYAIDIFKDLMPKTSEKLISMYNDWMWRNI